MQWLTEYPIATASSAVFYAFLALLAFAPARAFLAPFFVHPVPPHQKYLQGFDTIRGFAACLVAIGHASWATYPVFANAQSIIPIVGFAVKAVPIFAVLSGFLIYRSALSIASLQDLRAYVVRRFFRIYPVYLAAVLACLVIGQYVASEQHTGFAYFMADVFMFNVISWPGYANPPAWSLYIEVTFYAFMPLALITVGQRRMLLLAALAIAAMVLADHPSRVFVLWRYFMFGIVASELSPRAERWAPAIFAAGAIMFAADFLGPRADWVAKLGIGIVHNDLSTLALGLSVAMILMSLPHLPKIGAALNVLPLRLIGVISYSVYLTHFFYIRASFPVVDRFTQAGTQPVYELLNAMPRTPSWYLPFVFFPGILTWGAICFLLVERPGMRLGQYLLKRTKTPRAQAGVALQPAE